MPEERREEVNALSELDLVLFLTRGGSLRQWDELGMLDRELALYRALRPHLRGVTLVTYGDARDSAYGDRLDNIRVICNRWRLPTRWYLGLLCRVRPLFWRGPAVLKSNQVRGAETPLLIARRFGKKFVARCGYLRSFNLEQQHGSDSPLFLEAQRSERRVFTGADRVVVTTHAIKETIVERYGVPEEHVVVIPNYVDTGRFRPGPEPRPRAKRICYVGRLEEEKNPLAMLEALGGLDAELSIVGTGSLEPRLRKIAAEKNRSVQFYGNVPHAELPRLLRECDLFVLPSRYEGHPKALLEAMACGLPVIGTNVPGIRELLRHRETGYLCGTGADDIRGAIRELMSDTGLRARIGRNAREYVVRHFTLEQAVQKELALLEELA